MDRTGDVVSNFAPRPVRYIRITQTGENPREWWAIAEVFVHTASSSPAARVPEAAGRLLEGARFESEGRLASAVAAYERAVELDAELEEAHSGLARVYARAGLPIEGSDPHRRASVFANLGAWGRAARQYETLLEENADHLYHSDFLNRLLAIYRQQGAGDEVARIERRLVEDYAPPIRAEASFGGSVKLLGYSLTRREPWPGGVVELAYYWTALRPIPEDLSIFVHFRLRDQIRIQQDHEPLAGRYPTSRWRDGERIRESYRLRLPRNLPPGEYEIRIGVWNPKTGERLRVTDTSLPDFRDAVRLATVRILPSR
jgi:tetratricopeptide (TPR) repeat protein